MTYVAGICDWCTSSCGLGFPENSMVVTFGLNSIMSFDQNLLSHIGSKNRECQRGDVRYDIDQKQKFP